MLDDTTQRGIPVPNDAIHRSERWPTLVQHAPQCDNRVRAVEDDQANSSFTTTADRSAFDLDRELVRNRLRSRMFGIDQPEVSIGRFVLLKQIGSGGMGRVYAAWDEQLARRVALKLLRDDGSDEARIRVLREAQAQAQVAHPNVVPIYEAGVEQDRVWLAMEYVDGVTLREWCLVERDWRAILAVLIGAGRGLSAAHEVELIHRDFKPTNVMIGSDGRPRVLDFGLARGIGDSTLASLQGAIEESGSGSASASSSGSGSLLDRSVTVRGNMVGTPAYMAPEQHEGTRVDALSDQFSFCVTAYECLFGQRPFEGEGLTGLSRAILGGELRPVPHDTQVPKRVCAALLRGLSVDPGERWPDMPALLDELEAAASRPRHWRWGALGLVGVAIGLALGSSTRDQPPHCVIDASTLSDTWNDTRREQLQAAFADSELRGATKSGEVIAAHLDRWSDRWLDARREACEATHVRGTQPQALLDRRNTCFERRQRGARVLVDSLITAERKVVANAATLLEQLPDPRHCDAAHVEGAPVAPEDPQTASKILDGYEALTEAQVALLTGDHERARTLLDELSTGAALEHPPLELEIQRLIGQLNCFLGQPKIVISTLQPAVARAVELGLVDQEAWLRVELVRCAIGTWGSPDAEQLLIEEASLALHRVGAPDDPRWFDIEFGRAKLADSLGRYDEAVAGQRRALALAEAHELPQIGLLVLMGNTARNRGDTDQARHAYDQAEAQAIARWGPHGPQLAAITYNRGLLALDLGELDAAEDYLDDAHARYVELWGEDSLPVAQTDFAQAKLAMQRHELELGRRLCERAEPVFVRQLGPEHSETGYLLNALGVFRFFDGDYEGSIDAYQRALNIALRTQGEDHEQIGLLHGNIGQSQVALGRTREAKESFSAAIRVLERASVEEHPYLVAPLEGRGLARLDEGATAEAIRDLERALAILERDAREPAEQAAIRLALARALVSSDAARARTLAEAATAQYEALGQHEQAADARAWLDEI